MSSLNCFSAADKYNILMLVTCIQTYTEIPPATSSVIPFTIIFRPGKHALQLRTSFHHKDKTGWIPYTT
jgi:hypothetical protein